MKKRFASSTQMLLIGMLGTFTLIFLWSFTQNTEEKVEVTKIVNDTKYVAPSSPESPTFAGESVPTDIIDVKEKLDRELVVNSYWHSNTFLMIKRANRWFPVIEPILAKNGIPDDFKYLALIESGLTNAVSHAGATGFWQFMKATGQSYGLQVTSEVDERYHVEKSTEAACHYLRDAYDKFHSWTLVAASYNMGMAGLGRRLSEQQVDTYYDLLLNAETARYVYRIAAVKEIFDEPEAYGFFIADEDLYSPYLTHLVEVDMPVSDFIQFAQDQGINYKILKTLNPWLRKGQLSSTSGKTFAVKIPNDTSFKH
ncbi:MAG: membrane-bound lytic murein transglycosylase D [Flavobacteriales bacterium]|jgi:membrane-bound lytic murein transglycosylase D